MSSNDSNPPTPPPIDPPPTDPPNRPPADTLAEPLPPPPLPGDLQPSAAPPLQREAVVLVHDRGRLALLVSLATMAGVALGFTLALLAFRGDPSRGSLAVEQPLVVPRAPCDLHGTHPFWTPGGINIWHNDSRTWLGVALEAAGGKVRVSRVVDDSPADRAGILAGDIVRQLDGEAIATPSQLQRAVRDHDDGDRVTLELDRNGVQVTVTATLESRRGRSGSHIRIR